MAIFTETAETVDYLETLCGNFIDDAKLFFDIDNIALFAISGQGALDINAQQFQETPVIAVIQTISTKVRISGLNTIIHYDVPETYRGVMARYSITETSASEEEEEHYWLLRETGTDESRLSDIQKEMGNLF